MIIVVGGEKGGTGKTTLATHLAIMRAQEDFDVLLIDADDQQTSFDFSEIRNQNKDIKEYTCIKLSGTAVRTETNKFVEKYDDIIIDVGGRDTTSQRAALVIADKFIIPCSPRSFDIWSIDKASKLVEEIKTFNPNLVVEALINKADIRGADNKDAMDAINEYNNINCLDHMISNRKAFGNAAAAGKAVNELTGKDRDHKAEEEIQAVYDHMYYFDEEELLKETA